MDTRVSWRDGALVTCALLVLGGALAAQRVLSGAPPSSEVERPVTSKRTLAGFVLAPDGSPAEGAVVVSSAGGRAVTDVAGSYRLELELPLEARSLQVTATGSAGGDQTASTSVVPSGTTGTTRVDPLQLAPGSACPSAWIPTFGERPGMDNRVLALLAHDDGSGPALYAGGIFTTAGGVPANRIARRNGSSWSNLGSGMNGTVRALAVYDDGSETSLYAGGDFTTAGGEPAFRIARWNGSSWSALDDGLNDSVYALAVYDDGGGPALYAGGTFTTADGEPASRIAKWDGLSWFPIEDGVIGTFTPAVHSLAVYDDGGGPELYVGGSFSLAGGQAASGLAKWDGAWSVLQSPVNTLVYALTVFDDGGGPALYAGGVGGWRVAKWNGSSWSNLCCLNGTAPWVRSFAVYDDGGWPALYAGGGFTLSGSTPAHRIAKWNGSSWLALGSGLSLSGDPASADALAVYDDGSGPVLYVGGAFEAAGGAAADHLAKWDGSSWSPLSTGLNDRVYALAFHDEGGGTALYAGGWYTSAGGVIVNNIGRWNGSSWSALGSGTGGTGGYVRTLAVYDDGSGPALHAGGNFVLAGGVSANRIAKWDGASWSALGSGLSSQCEAMVVHDDGGGGAMYVGGGFVTAGGVTVNGTAKWDGASWSALGSGVTGNVQALAVYDDGSGPALHAAGTFSTAGGVTANRIAKWNGTSWSALGSGITGGLAIVSALVVHDDGGGPALYAGGLFSGAGGVPADNIARWDGSSWTPLGSGLGTLFTGGVSSLAAYADGGGPALYAGGNFTTSGALAVNRIAKWDGSSWSPLGSGMSSTVRALVVERRAGGPLLYAGGEFPSAFDASDSFLARWGCPLVAASPRARRR